MSSDPLPLAVPSLIEAPRVVGRYRLYSEIAAGGMATVHLGRLLGTAGFTRTVAIKRLHPQFAKDEEFANMFIDEARIAARIRHPNALTALDVVSSEGELYIVMDYIHGESLGRLLRDGPAPLPIAAAIISQALLGLHAAHEATDDQGRALSIVHRDVSPQNVLVGADGVVRVVDFGIAKAASRVHITEAGTIKGKVAYMSPQQLQSEDIDRRADIFASGVVLWEAVVGRRLLSRGEGTIARVMNWRGLVGADLSAVPLPLQAILRRALARDPDQRFATAREMAVALAEAVPGSSSLDVGEWVERRAAKVLAQRAQAVSDVERHVVGVLPPPLPMNSDKPTAIVEVTRSALSASTRNELGPPTNHRARNLWMISAAAAFGTILLLVATRPFGSRTDVSSSTTRPAPRALAAPVLPAPPIAAVPATASPSAPEAQAIVPLDTLRPMPDSRRTAPLASIATPIKKVRPAAVAQTTASKVNCNPRFDIDQDGVKHFKPECFQ